MENSTKKRYPILQHLLVLVPLLGIYVLLRMVLKSDDGAELFFDGARERNATLKMLAGYFSKYGNIIYYLVYTYILAEGLRRKDRDRLAFVARYLVGLLLTLFLTDVLKFMVGRPRPPVDGDFIHFTDEDSNHSFPSGHVGETISTATPIAQRFGKFLLPLLVGLSPAIMGLSRLYLGEHHPTDFLGSVAVSAIALFAAWKVVDLVMDKYFPPSAATRTADDDGEPDTSHADAIPTPKRTFIKENTMTVSRQITLAATLFLLVAFAARAADSAPAGGRLTLEQAEAKVLESVPGGKVVHRETDYDDGHAEYEFIVIDATTRHQFEVSSRDGVILKHKTKPIVRDGGAMTPTIESAKKTALEASGGGDIIKIREERRRSGRHIVKFKIINQNYEHEIKVDAETGAILEHDRDYLDD